MRKLNRSIHGLRDSMFDVLEQLRNKEISLSQAKAQMEAAKAVCMTVACEREELEVMQKQIELEEKLSLVQNRREAIEHVGQNEMH